MTSLEVGSFESEAENVTDAGNDTPSFGHNSGAFRRTVRVVAKRPEEIRAEWREQQGKQQFQL